MKNTSLEIKLSVDPGEVKTGLAKVQADFQTASSKISQALQSIKGFADLKKQTAEIAKDYSEAQRKVAELARKMAAGGGGAALARDFDKAKLAAGKLKDSLAAHNQQLHSVRSSMAAAGITTSNFSGQQAELRKQLEATKQKYQGLANVAQARTTLGLTSHNDIAKEIDRAKAAYATLRTSGTATMAELSQAKVRLRQRIDELREGTNGWKASLSSVKMGMLEIVAVAAPTVLAIGQAIKFESSMANVKKVVEGTPQEFAALRGELLELTRIIPMTANELAAIAVAGGQLGISGKDMMAFVTVTAKMATAFDMTADAAGEAIGKIKTLYGLSIQEIEALGDTINVLGNTMAAKEKDIVDVMLRIGGSVKQVGMGNDQAAALASTMLSLGMQTEVAGTAINAMINRLLTGTMQSGEFQDALAKIGLNAEQMAAMISTSPQQAIDTLLTSLGQLSGQGQAEVLTGLFGREHQDEIARLVTGVDAYRKALADLGVQADVTGSMNKEFAERVKTTEAQLQLLKNSVSEAGINLGTVFLPAINAIIAPITKGIQLLADFAEQFPNLSAAMVTIGTGAVAFGTIVKAAGIARLAVLSMKTDVIAAFVAIQGTSLGAWAASTVTALRVVAGGLLTVEAAAAPIIAVLAAIATGLLIGKYVGEFIGQFDIVQTAMVGLIHKADQARLAAQKMWAQFTGSDADVKAIDDKIAISDTVYRDMLADIKAGKGAGEKKTTAPEKQAETTPPAPSSTAGGGAPDTQKKADPGYRTPEYLDQLDEAVLSPEELEDRKKRWAEREQQEKNLNDEKNSKLDEVAKANAAEDKKREEIRAADHNRKVDPNSSNYDREYAQNYAAKQRRIAAEKAAEEARKHPPQRLGEQLSEVEPEEEPENDRWTAESDEAYAARKKAEAAAKAKKQADDDELQAARTEAKQAARWAAAAHKQEERASKVSAAKEAEGRTDLRKARLQADDSQFPGDQPEQQLESSASAETRRVEELAQSQAKAVSDRMEREKQATEQAKTVFEQYASRVKDLSEDMANRQKSLQDDLLDLDPAATEEEKWNKRKKMARDYEVAANKAMKAGNLEEALKLSDQASGAYKSLRGGAGDVPEDAAAKTVFSGVKSSGTLGLAIEKLLAAAAAKTATSGLNAISGLNNRVAGQLQNAMGAMAAAPPPTAGGKPTQVHEIRLGNSRLQGSPDDVADFIKQLELAGMRA